MFFYFVNINSSCLLLTRKATQHIKKFVRRAALKNIQKRTSFWGHAGDWTLYMYLWFISVFQKSIIKKYSIIDFSFLWHKTHKFEKHTNIKAALARELFCSESCRVFSECLKNSFGIFFAILMIFKVDGKIENICGAFFKSWIQKLPNSHKFVKFHSNLKILF